MHVAVLHAHVVCCVHKDDANGDLPMKAAEPESSTQAERLADQIATSMLSVNFSRAFVSMSTCSPSASAYRARPSEKHSGNWHIQVSSKSASRAATVASAISAQLDTFVLRDDGG
jgi:hypothetical protein